MSQLPASIRHADGLTPAGRRLPAPQRSRPQTRLRLMTRPAPGDGPARVLLSVSWTSTRRHWTLSAGLALRRGPGARAHSARPFPAPLIWLFMRLRGRPRHV
ncbi:hypothetical protein P7L78_13530 [Tistrella bauzanensis]|uniref:hypothetical protein n=1 Tax=Tistrella TaxID=171436 RepID=UPI0031F62134